MKSTPRPNVLFLLALLGCSALLLAIRLRWLGHLLMWDEAMNLCSTRAFVAGGHDAYSPWFWRYPPLFNLLLVLAQPLQAGFLARAEWVPVLLGVVQLIMLGVLNRRVFGEGPALWSCLALGVMPGAAFFGLWIKQDALVPIFGMLSLYLCAQKKWSWGGLALGFCFLSKEMAVFYALAVALVMVTERQYRALAIVAVIAGLASAWWFIGFSTTLQQFITFAMGDQKTTTDLWTKPWHYYAGLLLLDLGWIGIALAVLGAAFLIRSKGPRLWPLALLLPALLILSAARAKAPWYDMTLLPALATLQGVAAYELWQRTKSRFPAALPSRLAPAILTVATAVLIALPTITRSYEDAMREREEGMWWASSMSREAAETLNRLVKGEEKALITPMCYYGELITFACPIFVTYLKDMPVLIRPNTLTVEQFLAAVRGYELDWAMVSPPPGPPAQALLDPLKNDYGLKAVPMRGATILKTSGLWMKQP